MLRKSLVVFVMALGLIGCQRPPSVPGTQIVSTDPAPGQPPNPKVLLETSKGAITVELFSRNAPLSVANFLGYVNAGFYDGTIFHRVIPGFMIQGGGLTPKLAEKRENPPIHNEAANGVRNLRGTLAMARTNEPHSAGAQFFINVTDNRFLDHRGESEEGWGYAVFGKVTAGMDVVDAIVAVPRGYAGSYQDVPNEPVLIKHASVIIEAATK